MCDHGDVTMTTVHVAASVAFEGHEVVKPMPIDSCIAATVALLDANGLRMLASCCGHGKLPPRLTLADGSDISMGLTVEEETA